MMQRNMHRPSTERYVEALRKEQEELHRLILRLTGIRAAALTRQQMGRRLVKGACDG